MAKKGEQAREIVKNTIIDAFQATGDFVAFKDKKIYVQAKNGSNGEVLQFAITMTMPKTAIEAGTQTSGSSAWDSNSGNTVSAAPTELSSEDKEQVEKLKNKLKEMGVYQE